MKTKNSSDSRGSNARHEARDSQGRFTSSSSSSGSRGNSHSSTRSQSGNSEGRGSQGRKASK